MKKLVNENDASNKKMLEILRECYSVANSIINKPTTIEKVFPIAFTIRKDDIKDLFYTVEQRIGIDNISSMQFEIKIHFSDDSVIKFNNINEFDIYHEVRPLNVYSIELNWSGILFLKTTQSDLGEQIEINIAFSVPPKDTDDADGLFFIFNNRPIQSFGVIAVNIKHSNKIWAIDIISHIESFTKRIEKQVKSIGISIQKYRIQICKFFEFIIVISTLIPMIFIISRNFTDINGISRLFAISVIVYILSKNISKFVGRKIYNTIRKLRPKSFIIINKYSENEYMNEMKIKPKIIMFIVVNIIIPILIGLFTTYISKVMK